MASIDERVVAMSFENAKFEAGVARTMATLTKLDITLKNVGKTTGLGDIDKAANKVTFSGLTAALDKIRAKLHFPEAAQGFGDVERESQKVSFTGLSGVLDRIQNRFPTLTSVASSALDKLKAKLGFENAADGFSEIERASNKVQLTGASTAVDKLNAKLSFPQAADGFSEIEKASGKVTFGPLNAAVDSVSAKFSALTVAATSALSTIVMDATRKGRAFVDTFSFGPIRQGFQEYTTNLNSVQTILANTEQSGATLKDVNAALQELNHYSDQTIYNFSQMAKNIGTFTSAGVDLDRATAAIKGIANAAALGGADTEQASRAMYQLSQAIASGRVSLQDWNSVVNANMASTRFKEALVRTATVMGTLEEKSVKVTDKMGNLKINGESFRDSIMSKPGQESWLTSDVLVNTLSQLTGDLSDAQLAAQGYTDAQIKEIQQLAKTAKQSATEVKTLKGVFDVAKEAIGSGWALTFQNIFGDFGEAKELFTGMSNSIQDFIGENANARNKILTDWKKLGGRDTLIEGFKEAFKALSSVIKPVSEAFREIFPRTTGKQLYDLTVQFKDLMESFKIGPQIAENLKRTFRGFFAILDIGKEIVGQIFRTIGNLFKEVGEGSGGILNFTGNIGDLLVNLDEAIKKGSGLTKFFDALGAALAIPIKLISAIAEGLGSLFGNSDPSDAEGIRDAADSLNSSLSPMAKILDSVSRAWERFMESLGVVGKALDPLFDKVGDAVSEFVNAIGDAFGAADYDKAFRILETTLIGGIFVALKKGLTGGVNFDFSVFKDASGVFDSLTGSLKAMQNNLKANTLLQIATAVGVLAAGVLAISLIDTKKLAPAMTAIAVGLGQLVGAMALLTKVGGGLIKGAVTMPLIAGSIVILSGSLILLAAAMKLMATMDWEEIAKGLVGIGGGLTAIGIGTKLMGPSLILVGPGLIAVAASLLLLSGAMKVFATMEWAEIGKGLLGVAGGLTAIGVGLTLIGPSVLLIGPGLIGVAVALGILSGAILALGSMDLETLGKGIVSIGAALAAIGLGIMLIPPTVALQAAGLVILAVALNGIAAAVGILGSMDIATLAKGIISIGAALVVLAGGLALMSGTLPGAAALLVAAGALAILAPAIGLLGTMKWTTIIKGLVAIGAAIGVLAIAGTFAAAPLTALGIALLPLAGVMLVVSGSVYILAKGLALLGDTGSKSVAVMFTALTGFLAILPKIVIDFVKGLVEIIKAVASIAPDVVAAVVKIVESLLEVVIRSAPKLAQAFIVLVREGLRVLVEVLPQFITAGAQLLVALLRGIADNIASVTLAVFDIITRFLEAVVQKLPELIQSGAHALITFLSGITRELPKVIASAAKVITTYLTELAKHLPDIIKAGAKVVTSFLSGIADNIERVVEEGGKIIARVIRGIGEALPRMAKEGANAAGKFIIGLAEAVVKLADDVATAIIRLMNGVAGVIERRSGEFGAAAGRVAGAIVKAIAKAIPNFAGELGKAIADVGKNALDKVVGGIKFWEADVSMDPTLSDPNVWSNLATDVVKTGSAVEGATRSIDQMVDRLALIEFEDPVITPVLDLSSVETTAKRLDKMFVEPSFASSSTEQATVISTEQDRASDENLSTGSRSLVFEQNNYSPESLSDVTIYRQTRNQLAQARALLESL